MVENRQHRVLTHLAGRSETYAISTMQGPERTQGSSIRLLDPYCRPAGTKRDSADIRRLQGMDLAALALTTLPIQRVQHSNRAIAGAETPRGRACGFQLFRRE